MTTFNTDYNKTELLDHELEAVTGGKMSHIFELPDILLTPQQIEGKRKVEEMRRAGIV